MRAAVVRSFGGPEVVDVVERGLPEPAARTLEGVALPVLRLNGFEVSAVEKVAAALARL